MARGKAGGRAGARAGLGALLGMLVVLLAASGARAEEQGELPPPRVVGPLPAPPRAGPPARPSQPAERATPGPGAEGLPPPRVVRLGAPAASEPLQGVLPVPPWGGATRPPVRPPRRPEAGPADLLFEVERPGGVLRAFPEGEGEAVLVMLGGPHIEGFEHRRADGRLVAPLSIKANEIVAWIDLARFQALGLFRDLEPAPERAASASPRRAGRSSASLLQDAVLGIYATGAVELVYGDLVFRAEELYLEPRTYLALLLDARFEGSVLPSEPDRERLPLHVRARRARLLARGVAVFDDAEVTTSNAADRLALVVRRLRVEEAEDAEAEPGQAEAPSLMGFQSLSNQTYRAEGITFRGERLPLFHVPSVAFGYPDTESWPVRVRRFDTGRRTSLGTYAILGVGGPLGRDEDPLLDWTVSVGGYHKRGPGGGVTLEWDEPRHKGVLDAWVVGDFGGPDRSGYRAPDEFRGRLTFEDRLRLTDRLTLDAEWNAFTDRGFNLEYFERDELEHRDRESYLRLRHDHPQVVTTLTGKWHQREFVTETTEEPQLGLWVSSVPLLVPGRPGGVGADVTSVTRAGHLTRRFDDLLADEDYDALRFETESLLHVGGDAGDLRLTGHAGAAAASYLERSVGQDLTRTALLAGARANLQLHRTWEERGGPFQLDRLRHVVDLDVEFAGRFFDSHAPRDVPFFDGVDAEDEQSAAILRVRNRLQTRRSDGGVRDVLDLELAYKHYVDDVGPYGQRLPGAIEAWLRGEPRERLYVAGEGVFDLGRDDVRRGFAGVGARPWERVAVFLGFRYARGESAAPQVDVSWRFSERYGLRFLESYDVRSEENRARLLFRRHSPDHVIVFGVSARNDVLDFQIAFEPVLGGVSGLDIQAFNDEPGLDVWGAFP